MPDSGAAGAGRGRRGAPGRGGDDAAEPPGRVRLALPGPRLEPGECRLQKHAATELAAIIVSFCSLSIFYLVAHVLVRGVFELVAFFRLWHNGKEFSELGGKMKRLCFDVLSHSLRKMECFEMHGEGLLFSFQKLDYYSL